MLSARRRFQETDGRRGW